MKKILSIVLTIVMLVSMSCAVSAVTLNEALTGIQTTIKADLSASVKSGTDAYVPVYGFTGATVETYDFKSTLGTDLIKAYVNAANSDAQLKQDIITNDVRIKGTFVITITVDDTIFNGIVNSAAHATPGTMYGFAAGNDAIFTDTARNVVDNGDGTHTITINVSVKNPANSSLDYVTGQELMAHPEYLDTLEYNLSSAFGGVSGAYSATVTMTGSTDAYLGTGTVSQWPVTYVPEPTTATATVTVSVPSSRPSRPSTPSQEYDDVTVIVKGYGEVKAKVGKDGTTDAQSVLNLIPAKEGFVVAGLFTDKEYTTEAEGKIEAGSVLYSRYVNILAPEILESVDHFAYIIGIPSGEVRPEDNITRAEIATIVFRLLNEETRNANRTTEENYSDLDITDWYVTEAATVSKLGIFNGVGGGLFGGKRFITRGEFATVLARLYGDRLPDPATTNCDFTDIDGHWAEDNIRSVYGMEILNGYDTGEFGPNDLITRAQAMAFFNRLLVRYYGENDETTGEAYRWPDLRINEWYYGDVMEATNSHNYDRKSDKWNESYTDYANDEFTRVW